MQRNMLRNMELLLKSGRHECEGLESNYVHMAKRGGTSVNF